MGHTYYPQSDYKQTTMTVAELVEKLNAIQNQALPVIFQSPTLGVFGSGMCYSIDKVAVIHLPRHVHHIPAHTHYDEESREEWEVEAEDQIFHDWLGVMIG